MKQLANVRREFFKKLVAGVGTLWLFGRTQSANAEGGATVSEATYGPETQRRLALCREHIRVESAEAHFANLAANDPNNPNFAGTLNTLVENPHYVFNGAPVDGRPTVQADYNAFFAGLDNVKFEEKALYIAKQAIIFEVVLTANARGTTKVVTLPLMVAFVFDEVGGKIVGEHAYFDSAMIVAK